MMRFATLFFLIGILLCQMLSNLPDIRWTFLIFPLGICIWILPRHRLLLICLLGFLWVAFRANMILAQKLPHHLESVNVTLIGTVINIPQQKTYGWQFEFSPLPIKSWQNPGNLRLSWYGTPPKSLSPGQRWKLTVRLKRAHGTLNPRVFDYSQWLFQHHILATGTVVRSQGSLLSEPAFYHIDHIRYRLAERMRHSLDHHPSTGVILALALGEKQDISQTQWEILRQTGIAHLVAISGLHIGFIAWLSFGIARRFWGRMGQYLPAPYFAAIISVCAAFAYALLAGFSLPTQRALMMVIVVVCAMLFARKMAVSYIFTISLLAVLIWDPLSVLSAGFWLSFGAV
ncbi:MAG: ComEC/Rec2 family competence protein, partial [Thiomargarita sp.]|nr:ComEC/Rec2 family competence protein [Thiomargarita sp.]